MLVMLPQDLMHKAESAAAGMVMRRRIGIMKMVIMTEEVQEEFIIIFIPIPFFSINPKPKDAYKKP